MTTVSQANDLKLVLEGKTSNVSIHENQNTITDLLNDTPGCFPNGLPTVTLNPPRLSAQAFARSHRNTTKLAQPPPPRGCEGFRGLLLAALGTDAQGDKVRYRSPVLFPVLLPASVGVICDAASRARRPAAVNWFGELRGESADPPGICEGSLWRPGQGNSRLSPVCATVSPLPPGGGERARPLLHPQATEGENSTRAESAVRPHAGSPQKSPLCAIPTRKSSRTQPRCLREPLVPLPEHSSLGRFTMNGRTELHQI